MSHSNVDLRETNIIGQDTREYLIGPSAPQALAAYHIVLTGISYARPPFRFVRLRPPVLQLLACLEGQGEVLVDGQWKICTAGMAYLTPPQALHAYRATDDNQSPWKVCWVMYDLRRQERPVIMPDRPTLVSVEPQELARAIEGLYHEWMGQAEEAVMHQWGQLVHTYAQRIIGQEQFDPRLSRLWKMVDANLAHSWSAEELAAYVDMSSEHLRRLCQQQFGHSPMRHLTMMRMQRAMALLASNFYSVETVARHVGYENPFAFSTAFKRFTGMAPSVYRERN